MTVPPDKIVERSVDGLQKLYAVVMALAISQATMNFLRDRQDLSALRTPAAAVDLTVLGALLLTIVPFYHGMNRHLERSYLERDAGTRHSALLLDFSAFFLESFLLFAVSWSVRQASQAFLFLAVLLIVDVIWGVVSHFIHYAGGRSTVLRWSLINVFSVIIGFFAWSTSVFSETTKPAILLGLAFIRTFLDYRMGWEFYFPRFSKEEPSSGSA